MDYLQTRYQYYNKLLFANSLPDIPIKQKPLKNAGGVAKAKLVTNPNKPIPNVRRVRMGLEDKLSNIDIVPGTLHIVISSLYKRDNHQIDKILIHEMLHIYFYTNGMLSESHGSRFIKKAKDFEKICGFEIPLKDNIDDLEFSSDIKIKSIGVMLTKSSKKNVIAMSIFNIQFLKENIQKITKIYMHYNPEFYEISNKKWSELAMKYPAQRSMNIKRYIFEDQEAIDDLKKNGKILSNDFVF